MVTGFVKQVLRAEGLALFLAALVAYHILGESWWMFATLILVPDLSFIGFVFGPKIGSIAYNSLHSTLGPLLLGCLGWLLDQDNTMHIFRDICSLTALIWLAHIGFDRAVGYGLKYASAFKDTHLGAIGKN